MWELIGIIVVCFVFYKLAIRFIPERGHFNYTSESEDDYIYYSDESERRREQQRRRDIDDGIIDEWGNHL